MSVTGPPRSLTARLAQPDLRSFGIDSRAELRASTFEQARISWDYRRHSRTCVLADLPRRGARLRVVGALDLPPEFGLYIPVAELQITTRKVIERKLTWDDFQIVSVSESE